MKITQSTSQKILIEGAPNLDPVTVIIDDYGQNIIEITIKCYGKAWTMKARDALELFLNNDNSYLINWLWSSDESRTEPNFDYIEKQVRSWVLSKRRNGDIQSDFARELFDVGSWQEYMPKHSYDSWTNPLIGYSEEFKELEEWHLSFLSIPERYTSDAAYLNRIITTVKEALTEQAKITVPDLTDLDRQMIEAGMIPLSDMIKDSQIDVFMAHAGVNSLDTYEQYLIMCIAEYESARFRLELDKNQEHDMFEWYLAHGAAFKNALINFRKAVKTP